MAPSFSLQGTVGPGNITMIHYDDDGHTCKSAHLSCLAAKGFKAYSFKAESLKSHTEVSIARPTCYCYAC